MFRAGAPQAHEADLGHVRLALAADLRLIAALLFQGRSRVDRQVALDDKSAPVVLVYLEHVLDGDACLVPALALQTHHGCAAAKISEASPDEHHSKAAKYLKSYDHRLQESLPYPNQGHQGGACIKQRVVGRTLNYVSFGTMRRLLNCFSQPFLQW